MSRPTWEEYAIILAHAARTRSEDPYHQVGSALLRYDRTVAGLGYNGPPPKIEIDWSDRDGRRGMIVHAEFNALRYVKPGEVWLLASTMMPCRECLLQIAAYGISRVVYDEELDPAVYDVPGIIALAQSLNITLAHIENGGTSVRV